MSDLNLTMRDVAALLAKRCMAVVEAKALGPQKCLRLIADVQQFSAALVELLNQEVDQVQAKEEKKC
jgi:hypothetical protein